MGSFAGMASFVYQQALRALSRAQDGVAARSQLMAIGVPHNTVAHRCRPGGPWQQPLPRVIVLHNGPLTAVQRCWSALCYAVGRSLGAVTAATAVVTGEMALALHGVAGMPHPHAIRMVDVTVSHASGRPPGTRRSGYASPTGWRRAPATRTSWS